MNWFAISGALLHVLKHAPEYVDTVERLFDALRSKERAPMDAWQAVTDKISEVRKHP